MAWWDYERLGAGAKGQEGYRPPHDARRAQTRTRPLRRSQTRVNLNLSPQEPMKMVRIYLDLDRLYACGEKLNSRLVTCYPGLASKIKLQVTIRN